MNKVKTEMGAMSIDDFVKEVKLNVVGATFGVLALPKGGIMVYCVENPAYLAVFTD